MKYALRTETGSLYHIDCEALTWERSESTDKSGYLRTDGGTITSYKEPKLGQPFILLCPALVPMTFCRIIMTTAVISIGIEP